MFFVKRNLPIWERILRLCVSICFGVAAGYFLNAGIPQTLLFVTAIIFAGTALIGFCPACAMLGRKAIRDKK